MNEEEPNAYLRTLERLQLPMPSSSSDPNVSMIPEKAHHPILNFPPRTIGKQRQLFCSSWYQKYPWLHYQEANDSVLCFHCHVAERRHLPITLNKDLAFLSVGFSNWKKAIECFNKHKKLPPIIKQWSWWKRCQK